MTAVDRPKSLPVPGKAVMCLLNWSQVPIWGGYLLLLAKLLIAGMLYGFDFWPFGSDGMMRDPKDLLGLGPVETILHFPMLLIVFLGIFPAAMLLIASLPFAAMLWAAKDPRRWFLSVNMLLTAAFVVMFLTPFHRLLGQWMLD